MSYDFPFDLYPFSDLPASARAIFARLLPTRSSPSYIRVRPCHPRKIPQYCTVCSRTAHVAPASALPHPHPSPTLSSREIPQYCTSPYSTTYVAPAGALFFRVIRVPSPDCIIPKDSTAWHRRSTARKVAISPYTTKSDPPRPPLHTYTHLLYSK